MQQILQLFLTSYYPNFSDLQVGHGYDDVTQFLMFKELLSSEGSTNCSCKTSSKMKIIPAGDL